MIPAYALVLLPAVWQIRSICLLERDECGSADLAETVVSSRLILAACVLLVVVLLSLTFSMVGKVRNNTVGVDTSVVTRRFNVNGYVFALAVYGLYAGISVALLLDAANDLEPFSIEKADAHFWKAYGTMTGTVVVGGLLWHLNEYFTRPASWPFQAILFLVTLGVVYRAAQLPV